MYVCMCGLGSVVFLVCGGASSVSVSVSVMYLLSTFYLFYEDSTRSFLAYCTTREQAKAAAMLNQPTQPTFFLPPRQPASQPGANGKKKEEKNAHRRGFKVFSSVLFMT